MGEHHVGEDPEEVPSFHLPEWGTEGAPPPPTSEPSQPATSQQPSLLVTTTDQVPGRTVHSFLGLVVGEAVGEANAEELQAVVETARGRALERMRDRAAMAGAHAVVGVRLGVTLRKRTVLVTAVGTAVSLRGG